MCAFGSVHTNEHTLLWKYSQGTGVHGDETKKGETRHLNSLTKREEKRKRTPPLPGQHSYSFSSNTLALHQTLSMASRAYSYVCQLDFQPRVWARTHRECGCTVTQKEAMKGNATLKLDRTPGWAWVLRSPGASPDFWPASRPRRSDIPTGCKDKESSVVASRIGAVSHPALGENAANRRVCCRISGQFQRLLSQLERSQRTSVRPLMIFSSHQVEKEPISPSSSVCSMYFIQPSDLAVVGQKSFIRKGAGKRGNIVTT